MTSPKPEPAGAQRVTWFLLLVALAASVWLVAHAKPRTITTLAPVDLLRVVPSGPELLVAADLGGLDQATAKDLLRGGGDALLGLQSQCGIEPLLGVKRALLAVPFWAEPQQGAADFALVAETSLDQEAVLRCAETVIQKHGGRPVRSRLGRFTSVRDQAKPQGEVAMRDDGLFVLSGGSYFREVIDAADGAASGDEAARLRTQVHLALRRKLGPSQLTATLVPGGNWRLPGVQALALGLSTGRDVEVRGWLGCPTADACNQAREIAESVKADPAVPGLEGVQIVGRGAELDVNGRLPREQLAPLLRELLAP